MKPILLFLILVALITACTAIPTDVTMHLESKDYPGCPWPIPIIGKDTVSKTIPLGCPYADSLGHIFIS